MRFSKIKDNDIANGLGIVMSLWTQGCPHHCEGCFNPETWRFDEGREFTKNDLDYIINNIDKNNINRNLSILGGEPLCSENIDGVIDLCKEFKYKYPDKLIYIWTGYTIEKLDDNQIEVLKYVDVLIDGKFEQEKRNLSIMLRGSENQRIIDVKQYIKSNKIVIVNI